MKNILSVFILLSFLTFGFIVLAQENDLPSPGLTPDSHFYFLKTWKENIRLFFIFGAENKAKQFLHLSEVRLAEYQKMVEKGKTEIAQKTLEKYERQLDRALEKAEEAKEKGKNVEKLKEEIGEKILKHQEVLEGILEKVPEQAKEGIEKVIESSQKGFEKAIEAVPKEKKEELERKAEEIKSRIEEKIEAGSAAPKETPESCIQVITPAISPENTCKEFPTPCDMPEDWKKVDKCPSEIRYYTCPDGTKVVSGECYGQGETLRCALKVSPELQCSAPTPPVTAGAGCQAAGEIKYYQCPNNTQATWCACGPESGAVGAKNVWRCQHLPQLACPKSAVTSPVLEETVCCIDGKCAYEAKKQCISKSGKVVNSCAECITPAPAPVPLSCTVSGIKDYKCPDGTSIKWQCSCGEDSWSCKTYPAIFCPGLRDTTSLIISDIWIRDMFWTEEPPVPNVTQGPGIFHVFWGTSKPATSYIEYGLTDSYGLTTPTPPSSLGIQHTNNGQTELKGNTLYHSRIIATDTQGNTAASDDFTFFPAFNFTTIPGTVQPFIRLLGPGIAPEHWKIGGTHYIAWEARGVNKVNIDLVMFDSSGNRLKTYSIARDVSFSGATGEHYDYTWKVPSNSEFLQAGYKFKVVISDPVTFIFGINDNDLFIQE